LIFWSTVERDDFESRDVPWFVSNSAAERAKLAGFVIARDHQDSLPRRCLGIDRRNPEHVAQKIVFSFGHLSSQIDAEGNLSFCSASKMPRPVNRNRGDVT